MENLPSAHALHAAPVDSWYFPGEQGVQNAPVASLK
jgi:hypothetical protein